MTKKLFTQIINEWKNNLWLLAELLVVSVVLWYVIDNLYCNISILSEPLGFDIEHCYKIEINEIDKNSTDYQVKTEAEKEKEYEQIIERLRRMPETEAVCFSDWTAPYDLSESYCTVSFDTLNDQLRNYYVSPDYMRVFRIRGIHGETPEEMSRIMERGEIVLSGNIFGDKGVYISTLIQKEGFYLYGNKNQTANLGAVAQTVRHHDYVQGKYCKSIFLPYRTYDTSATIYLRVKAYKDRNFIENLLKNAEKEINTGNLYLSNVCSMKDMKRVYLQEYRKNNVMYLTGMGFLLLNIFLGLLGTFWFRTQQRQSEIALHKVHGATHKDVFLRLICEGGCLIALVTLPALLIDFQIAGAELNAVYNGTTFHIGRIILCAALSALSIGLMMVIGIGIPARKVLDIEPAQVLRGE
ncbi:MAG: ABC transporter permease [Bacteroides sp.]|jgi:putative ABC transport system permease protein|nr:ABC transporter permease [Bacteroides sp.]